LYKNQNHDILLTTFSEMGFKMDLKFFLVFVSLLFLIRSSYCEEERFRQRVKYTDKLVQRRMILKKNFDLKQGKNYKLKRQIIKLRKAERKRKLKSRRRFLLNQKVLIKKAEGRKRWPVLRRQFYIKKLKSLPLLPLIKF